MSTKLSLKTPAEFKTMSILTNENNAVEVCMEANLTDNVLVCLSRNPAVLSFWAASLERCGPASTHSQMQLQFDSARDRVTIR